MNLLKRIKLYRYFRAVTTDKKQELREKFNIHIDDIGRLYTICSITEEEYLSFGVRDEQNFNFSDPNATKQLKEFLNNSTGSITTGDDYLDIITIRHIQKVDNYLTNLGLQELYGLSEKSRIDRYNMKVVIEYKHINIKRWANTLLFVLFSTIIGIVGAGFLSFISLF